MINIDKTHKSFVLKTHTNNKSKKTLFKVAPYFLSLGMMLGLSGCSGQKQMMDRMISKNETIMDNIEDGNLDVLKITDDRIRTEMLPIGNEFIEKLPYDLKGLVLCEEHFITDLSKLPEVCPSLETLELFNCYSITDFSFLDEMPNLESVYIMGENAGIDRNLIESLDKRGIKHNLSDDLIKINDTLDSIIEKIITPDMDDSKKVNVITSYVVEHMSYDNSAMKDYVKAVDYNMNPLTHALGLGEDETIGKGTGLCINYAALLNALLSKAGIYSTIPTSHDHVWNLVMIEGKYYYIDPTNLPIIPVISNLILKYTDIGMYYKQDPYDTFLSGMLDIDSEYTFAPESLIKLINEANDKKNFIEKYGSNLYIDIITIIALLGTTAFIKTKDNKKTK